MGRLWWEGPLSVQIGAVVVLFAAALGTLWYTSSKPSSVRSGARKG